MKRGWILFSIICLMVACVVIVITQRPNETDFAKWMEKTYQIQCHDNNCNAFQIDDTEGKEPILIQSIRGGYSPGIFVTEVNNTYRNLNDPSYILDIKVEGFLRSFYIKEETIKNIQRR